MNQEQFLYAVSIASNPDANLRQQANDFLRDVLLAADQHWPVRRLLPAPCSCRALRSQDQCRERPKMVSSEAEVLTSRLPRALPFAPPRLSSACPSSSPEQVRRRKVSLERTETFAARRKLACSPFRSSTRSSATSPSEQPSLASLVLLAFLSADPRSDASDGTLFPSTRAPPSRRRSSITFRPSSFRASPKEVHQVRFLRSFRPQDDHTDV